MKKLLLALLLIFGLAMAWAGGCAAGVWYKTGEGKGGSLIALLGLIAVAVWYLATGVGHQLHRAQQTV